MVKKIYALICSISSDKLLHIILGLIIFSLCNLILLELNIHSYISRIISLTIVAIVSLLKEIYDKYKQKESFDIKDSISTILGGFITFLISII